MNSHDRKMLVVCASTLIILVVMAFLLNASHADAHAQIYGHAHPHPQVDNDTDLALTCAWISGTASVVLAVMFFMRDKRRSGK